MTVANWIAVAGMIATTTLTLTGVTWNAHVHATQQRNEARQVALDQARVAYDGLLKVAAHASTPGLRTADYAKLYSQFFKASSALYVDGESFDCATTLRDALFACAYPFDYAREHCDPQRLHWLHLRLTSDVRDALKQLQEDPSQAFADDLPTPLCGL